MADSNNNIADETHLVAEKDDDCEFLNTKLDIEKYIYNSITKIRKEKGKRPDKEAIFNEIQKVYGLQPQDVGNIFDELVKLWK